MDVKIYAGLKIHCMYSSNTHGQTLARTHTQYAIDSIWLSQIYTRNDWAFKNIRLLFLSTQFFIFVYSIGVECLLAVLTVHVYVYAHSTRKHHFKIKFKMSLKRNNLFERKKGDLNGSKYTLSRPKFTHLQTKARSKLTYECHSFFCSQ